MIDLSVIIPFYNMESHLDNVNAHFCKETDFTYEVIYLNDGSTDGGREKAESFIKDNGRVKLINLPHAGVSEARNAGIKAAAGEFIYFCDADDDPDFNEIAKLLKTAKKLDVQIIVGQYVSDYGARKVKEECVYEKDKIFGEDYMKKVILANIVCGKNSQILNTLWNKIYKRSVIVENGISFDKDRVYGEDWRFNIDLLCTAQNIMFSDAVVYKYKQRSENTLEKYKNAFTKEALIKSYKFKLDLIDKYSLIDKKSDEYIRLKISLYYNVLQYVAAKEKSVKDKKELLSDKTVRNALRSILKINRNDMQRFELSGIDKKNAFLLLIKKTNLIKNK